MKAVIHSEFGPPELVLRVVDVAAEDPGADEVIVQMEAAAMHIADLRTINGVPPFVLPLPRTPGFEGIGNIARIGRAVSEYKIGDRVFPALASGTFREEVRCKAADCIPAPSGDALQLALLTVNGPTAEVMLRDFADLQAGDWLIQNAANSSCGRYLIRLAQLSGIRTVNVVRRAEMVAELRSLGGDVVLVDGDDLPARVAAAVLDAPLKLGIDAIGGVATQRIAECLTPSSTVVSYGSMSGTPCQLDFYLMFRNDIRLVGLSFVRQFQRTRSQAQVRALYTRLAGLMSRGVLVAKIAGVYALQDVVTACRRAAQTGADRDGKVILRMR